MSDVHEDAGHTLVNFLYSGDYETINSPLDESTSDVAREYKRSVLVYQASRTYSLPDLEFLAKQKIEILGEEMSMLDILQTTRDVFSSLPEGETWLPSYIERNLQQCLKSGQPGIVLDKLYSTIGQNHHFDNAVMKMMLEILSARVLYDQNEPAVKEPESEKPVADKTVEECPDVRWWPTVREPDFEEPDADKSVEECPDVGWWPAAAVSLDNSLHAEELPDATTPSSESSSETQPIQYRII
ncbi:hypothetical protein BDW59DRAFT_164389 [Aspergillus cavernicola]|uniref:BTB domain-containing protein n=1 Tax=Aspergillus cavernicola TaxID=176166 RepID=A0ABR4HZR5_9EURO